MAFLDKQLAHLGKQPEPEMQRCMVVAGIPPGLEYLTTLDQLNVHREFGRNQFFPGLSCEYSYYVRNAVGVRLYVATQYSRERFEIDILDEAGVSVLTISRPCSWAYCCCPNCYGKNKTGVRAAITDEFLGSVKAVYPCVQPTYHLMNAEGELVFICQTVKRSPWYDGRLPVLFEIRTPNGVAVGSVVADIIGVRKDRFGKRQDIFGARFPLDLDPRMKAVILGATFVIYNAYFEKLYSRRPGIGMIRFRNI